MKFIRQLRVILAFFMLFSMGAKSACAVLSFNSLVVVKTNANQNLPSVHFSLKASTNALDNWWIEGTEETKEVETKNETETETEGTELESTENHFKPNIHPSLFNLYFTSPSLFSYYAEPISVNSVYTNYHFFRWKSVRIFKWIGFFLN
jgi:hypothetical protein